MNEIIDKTDLIADRLSSHALGEDPSAEAIDNAIDELARDYPEIVEPPKENTAKTLLHFMCTFQREDCWVHENVLRAVCRKYPALMHMPRGNNYRLPIIRAMAIGESRLVAALLEEDPGIYDILTSSGYRFDIDLIDFRAAQNMHTAAWRRLFEAFLADPDRMVMREPFFATYSTPTEVFFRSFLPSLFNGNGIELAISKFRILCPVGNEELLVATGPMGAFEVLGYTVDNKSLEHGAFLRNHIGTMMGRLAMEWHVDGRKYHVETAFTFSVMDEDILAGFLDATPDDFYSLRFTGNRMFLHLLSDYAREPKGRFPDLYVENFCRTIQKNPQAATELKNESETFLHTLVNRLIWEDRILQCAQSVVPQAFGVTDRRGLTPLHSLCSLNSIKVRKASFSRNRFRWFVFHLAAKNPLLLSTRRGKDLETPLHILMETQNMEDAGKLRRRSGLYPLRPDDEKVSSYDILQRLIALNPKTASVPNRQGFLPVHIAAMKDAPLDIIFTLMRSVDPSSLFHVGFDRLKIDVL